MHICYLTGEYPILDLQYGGVGTFIKNLGHKLVRQGVEVSVVCFARVSHPQVIDDHGVKVHLFPEVGKVPLRFFWNSLRLQKAIRQIHRAHPIDIIEAAELGFAFLNKIPKVQYVIRMHGGHHFFVKAENRPLEPKKAWREKKSFAKADAIVAVSDYVGETTRKLLALGDRKITVIYNPIDTKRFYQSDEAKIVPHALFFAGSIIEKKGIRQLVQALEYLVDDYPDLTLEIAGRDVTIPGTGASYRPILEQAISDKIRPHITFLGSLPHNEIPQHIERAQICCYPSHMEAMPLAWLEVLAMGKVFLGSQTGPGPEAVRDGETGFLVDPHDPKAIADKIRYIFEHYPQALEMAKKARSRVIAEFDIDILVQKNIDFYRSTIG